MAMFLMVVCLVILSVFVLYRWRLGVVLVFIWLFIGDMIRKIIPGQPPEIMLIGDTLLFLTYLSFFAMIVIKNKKLWKPPFISTLLLLLAFILINVLNPNSPGLVFGIIGIRSYLWYVPLLFLGYYMFASEDKLLKFCRILVYTTIPLFTFAIIQYIFYDSNFVIFRPFEIGHQIHSFGWIETGAVKRITALWGEAQRYATFSMFLFFLGMATYSASKKNKILLLSTIYAFLGVVISSSRVTFILSIVGFIMFSLLTSIINMRKLSFLFIARLIKVSLLVSLVITIGLLTIYKFFGGVGLFQISAFHFALEERIPWFLQEFSNIFSELNCWGYGTGTASQGLQYIQVGREWGAAYRFFESGISKILFELGILGFIFFYLLWGHLLYRIRKELKILNSSSLRNIGVSVYIFLILVLIRFSFIHHEILGETTTLVTLWFFIGVMFNLKNLESMRH